MKKLLFLAIMISGATSIAQPVLPFQKTYGGTNHEYIEETIPTSDGGFAFVGYSESSDMDVPLNKGGEDLWVAKANSAGTLQWSVTFGGTENDEGISLVEGNDGCIYVAGRTGSRDGDVVGNHGTYGNDLWVIKLTAGGSLIHMKCFGGTDDDEAAAIVFDPNGNLIVAGTTYSNDGDVSGNHGSYETDLWVIRIDTALTLLAQKCVGGSDYEEGIDMVATADNGCAITGRSYSIDGDITGYHDGSDMVIAKLSSTFVVEWAKCFGGSETEEGNSIVQLADASYCVLGYTSTHNNGDVTGHHGAEGMDDYWLVKVSAAGILEWAKCYGGSGDDQANGLVQAADGGYALCGLTNSMDGDVTGFHTGFFAPDYWVAKTDGSGNLQWQRCCGGSGQDESFRIYEESSGIFVVTGFTYSPDYDVTNWKGDADGWIIKVTGSSPVTEYNTDQILVFPVPASETLNIQAQDVRSVEVINALGQCLLNQDCGSKVDVSKLPSGIYTLKIYSENRFFTRKIIVE